MVLDKKLKIFIVYIATLEIPLIEIIVHFSKVVQIINGNSIQVVALQ